MMLRILEPKGKLFLFVFLRSLFVAEILTPLQTSQKSRSRTCKAALKVAAGAAAAAWAQPDFGHRETVLDVLAEAERLAAAVA